MTNQSGNWAHIYWTLLAGGVLASTVAFASLWSVLFLRISREERRRPSASVAQTVGG